MHKQELIKQAITYLRISTMGEKEKSMWTFMLPNMEEKHIEKLLHLLKEEAEAKTDLFLEAYEKRLNT